VGRVAFPCPRKSKCQTRDPDDGSGIFQVWAFAASQGPHYSVSARG